VRVILITATVALMLLPYGAVLLVLGRDFCRGLRWYYDHRGEE
jgi:hypothetical protein